MALRSDTIKLTTDRIPELLFTEMLKIRRSIDRSLSCLLSRLLVTSPQVGSLLGHCRSVLTFCAIDICIYSRYL